MGVSGNKDVKVVVYDKEQTRKKLHSIIDNMIDNREDRYDYHKIPTWKTVSPTPAMIYTALYRLGLTDSETGLIRVNHNKIKLSEDIKDIFRMLSMDVEKKGGD